MYMIYELEEWVGIPPDKVYSGDVDLDREALGILREELEDRLIEDIGYVLAVLDARIVGDGVVVSLGNDPNVYFPVKYRVLAYQPVRGEVVKAVVTKVERASLLLNLGPTTGKVPRDQIMDEPVEIDDRSGIVRGMQSKREVEEGDVVRARITHIAKPGRLATMYLISLTMKGGGLGKEEWIEASAKKEG